MAGPGVISFTRTEKYTSHVADELKEIRDARIFSDFKICIKEEVFPCHRLVLSVHSAMIKAMLLSDMAEAAKQSVNLNHIDQGIMKYILDYMYIGQVSFQSEQLGDMIIACDYLRINMLKDMCVNQVSSTLHPENAVMWFKLSHKLDLMDIKSQCLEIITASFTTISRQPDFVDLSLVNFQECLHHVQKSSQQQDGVLDAAMKWVDRDSSERQDHLETLVEQVQLDQCSLQGVLGVMNEYSTIITSAETLYKRLITAAMEISSTMTKIVPKPTLVIIGGQEDEEVSLVCWKLTKDEKVKEKFKIPFDDLQHRHSVCKTPKGFVISGGLGSTLCVMFNSESKKWSKLQNMMAERYGHGSVFVKGVLYVIGGWAEGEESRSVHSFLIEEDEWKAEQDAPACLSNPNVAELNERIVMLDQKNGHLFQLDIQLKQWTAKASLPKSTYHGVSMTSFNGKLYVAGEMIFAWYLPTTNTWVTGQYPNKLHMYGSLVPYKKKLLLLGGSFSKGTDEVDEYDFDEKTWTASRWKMPARLRHHHALVLDIQEI